MAKTIHILSSIVFKPNNRLSNCVCAPNIRVNTVTTGVIMISIQFFFCFPIMLEIGDIDKTRIVKTTHISNGLVGNKSCCEFQCSGFVVGVCWHHDGAVAN